MPDGKGRYQREDHPDVIYGIASEIKSFLNNNSMGELTADNLVDYADKIGDSLAREIGLKTTQIRKFLNALYRIKVKSEWREEYDYRTEVILLKPILAYAAARHKEVKPLMDLLEPCMNKISNGKDFQQFFRFVEAIVAYHRYHGGGD